MKKVIMKRVPKKLDISSQHKIMKNWSSVIVEMYSPDEPVSIIPAKKVSKISEEQSKELNNK